MPPTTATTLRRATAVIAVAFMAAACGNAPVASSIPFDAFGLANGVQYQCDGRPIDPDAIAAPGNDEQADPKQAAALRAYIAQTARDVEPLPTSGWHVTDRTSTSALFLTTSAVGADPRYVLSVQIRLDVALGERAVANHCRPEVVLPAGINLGSWTLDASTGSPTPATQRVHLLVQEQVCASGMPATDRIVGPAIQFAPDRVLVLFGVRQADGTAFTCQANPQTPVTIDLGVPLGNRLLVDPGRWPPTVVSVSNVTATPD